MLGAGFDEDVRTWFVEARGRRKALPRTTVDPHLVERALAG